MKLSFSIQHWKNLGWDDFCAVAVHTRMQGIELYDIQGPVFRGKERADGMPVIAGAFVAINIKNQSPTSDVVFAGDDANTLSGLLTPATATVAVGSTLKLQAIPLPFGVKGEVTYSSGTPAKATVGTYTGVITGVATGSSIITAACGEFTATCTVTVTT